MPWAAAAAVAGAVITSNATKSAANKQSDAAKDASAVQKYMYDQTRSDNMPALTARNASLQRLQQLLGIDTQGSFDERGFLAARPDVVEWLKTQPEGTTGYDFYKAHEGMQQGDWYNQDADFGSLNKRFTGKDLASEPGYQFGLQQGVDAVQNSAAARGGFYSGAALKALTQFGNDYAGTKYNDARNRFMSDQDTTFNRLTGLATGGQTGSNTIAEAGQNYANGVSSNLIGAGNTRAASTMAGANAWTNASNQVAAWWQRQPAGANAYTTPGTDGSYGNVYGDGYGIDPYGQLGGSSTAGDYSDMRLKTEIRHVGTTHGGLPIYTYRYKSGGPVRMGVMAQELEQVDPGAVLYDDAGFRLVDYSKVK